MQGAGLHDEVDSSVVAAGLDLAGVTTFVGLAPVSELAGRLVAAANARAVELADTGAEDAVPSASAAEVMLAVGGVHHEVTVAACLGQARVDATNAHMYDAVRNAPQWVEQQTGISRSSVRDATAATLDALAALLGRFVGENLAARLVLQDSHPSASDEPERKA